MIDNALCPYCDWPLVPINDNEFACDNCLLVIVKDELYGDLVEAEEYGEFDYYDGWMADDEYS